jgi:hypothetical protein
MNLGLYILIGFLLFIALFFIAAKLDALREQRNARRKRNAILEARETILVELKHLDRSVRLSAIRKVVPPTYYLPYFVRGADIDANMLLVFSEEERVARINTLVDTLGPVIHGDSDPEIRRAAAEYLREIAKEEIKPCNRPTSVSKIDLYSGELEYRPIPVSKELEHARQRLEQTANSVDSAKDGDMLNSVIAAYRRDIPTELTRYESNEGYLVTLQFIRSWIADGDYPKLTVVGLTAVGDSKYPSIIIRQGAVDQVEYQEAMPIEDWRARKSKYLGDNGFCGTAGVYHNYSSPGKRLVSPEKLTGIMNEVERGLYKLDTTVAIDGNAPPGLGGKPHQKQAQESTKREIAQPTMPDMNSVKFIKKEQRVSALGNLGTDEIYKAADAVSAQAFLQTKTVSQMYHIIIVETPEGNYCKDANGTYKE